MAEWNGGKADPTRVRAGASAQAEYERRAATDAERRRAGQRKTIVLMALAPFIGYALVRMGAVVLDWSLDRLQSWAESNIDANSEPQARKPMYDSGTLHTFGL